MRLLVIEDEPQTGMYLRKGLTESGYTTDLVSNRTDVHGAPMRLGATACVGIQTCPRKCPQIEGQLPALTRFHPRESALKKAPRRLIH